MKQIHRCISLFAIILILAVGVRAGQKKERDLRTRIGGGASLNQQAVSSVPRPMDVRGHGLVHPNAIRFSESAMKQNFNHSTGKGNNAQNGIMTIGGPADINAATLAGANYLKNAQSSTDGGWDWVLTLPTLTHSGSPSAPNLYGACALGMYYAYLRTNDASYKTAMQLAADNIVPNAEARDASSLKFLMLFNDLPGVAGTAYKDAAKAKYDGILAAHGGTATSFAEYLRDERGITEGYPNGIIGWDLGAWAVEAQMLYDRYGGSYHTNAVDIADVAYNASFVSNTSYFDLVRCAGWDPTWGTVDYWWYNLGVSGLIDAFRASNSHTGDIPGLVTKIMNSQGPAGAICGSYGVHTNDEDWQATAYAIMTLHDLNPSTYATSINHAAYYLAATQDGTGAWVYSDNTHYPEVGGECTSGLYFGSNAATVWVDDDYTSSSCGGHFWGYDAFTKIQDGIDGVVSGGTVNVYPGTYHEIAAGRMLYDDSGPYQFGLFFGGAKPGVIVQGVTAMGAVITDYHNVAATVLCTPTNSFGYSGVFVEADNTTITGLKIKLEDGIDVNKTLEIIGDNFTLRYCHIADWDLTWLYGGSVYINDWRYNAGTSTSHVQAYTIESNLLDLGNTVDIASGAGYTGPASGRKIRNNTFDLAGLDYPGVSFNGVVPEIGWFLYPVGGDVIEGNSFTGGIVRYIRARGVYDNSQFNWAAYWNNNTFDKAVVVGPNPPATLREFSYSSSGITILHVRDIGTVIQDEIDHGLAGDIVLAAAGTYNELPSIGKGLTVQGAGIGSSIIDAHSSAVVGNVVSISLASGNVLFDGFTVKTGTSTNGIYAHASSSGPIITISHDRIEGFGPTATGDNFGLITNGSYATLVFTNNVITNCGSNSILLERHYGPSDVSYNMWDRTSKDEASDGYFAMNYGGTVITSLQKVSHNAIDMGAGTIFDNSTRGTGITFAGSYSPPGGVGGYTNVQVTDNTIYNLKASRRGIGFWNAAPTGSASQGEFIAPVVSGNTITGAPGATASIGIRLLGQVTNASITKNTIDMVDVCFRGQAWNGHIAGGTHVNLNSFTNSATGFDWQGSTVLDALYNFWGSPHGPTDLIGTIEVPRSPKPSVADMKNAVPAPNLGINVTENVDYFPWLGKRMEVAHGGGIWASAYGSATSNSVFAGIDPAALDGVDPRDTVAPPPPPGEYIYLYFLLAPGQPISNYSIDIKKDEASLATKAKAWDLKSLTNLTSHSITMELPPTSDLPSGFTPVLYDLATGNYQNLRANAFYTYTSPGTETPSSFTILIGDSTKPSVTVTYPNGGEFLIAGQPYTITWTSSDPSGVLAHDVYYSLTGSGPYTLIGSVSGSQHSLLWTPPSAAGVASIKVVARDSVLNEQQDISDHSFAILSSNTLTFNAAAGWNLVSVPMLQADMTPSGIFGDNYGATPYYVFQFNPTSGYFIPGSVAMGQGYWLGSNNAQLVDAIGTPQSTGSMLLANGFNIIGNPFTLAEPIDSLKFTNGSLTLNITGAATAGWLSNVVYGYTGSGYYAEAVGLGVWQGYWIPMLTSGITIQYTPSVGSPGPKVMAPPAAETTPKHWGIDLSATLVTSDGRKFTDRVASFGVREDAKEGYDNLYDAPRPPRSPADGYIEVTFPMTGDGYPKALGTQYARDFRPADKAAWEFTVNTAGGEGTVTLSWDNGTLKTLPADVKIEFRDVLGHRSVDMKKVNSYTYEQTGTSRRFTVNKAEQNIPATYELSQNYPNPFNPTTMVTFGLPYDAKVNLEVYNFLGQKVATLTDSRLEAGYHEVKFDASSLSSGMYFYRMTADAGNGNRFTDTRKMMFIK